MNDNVVFIASCINYAISHEIEWPDQYECIILGQMLLGLHGVIGALTEPSSRSGGHTKTPTALDHWFNGGNKICSINNTTIEDNNGMFIFMDLGYSVSFHDVTCLRTFNLDMKRHNYFTHIDDYFKMVLGDVGYMGANRYMLR